MVELDIATVLRQYEPASIRAYDAHDDVREIAVPHGRTRWRKTAATVAARPWVRVDLLDKSGKVLAHVDNEGAAGDLEELGPVATATMARDERMLALLMRAQREALQLTSRDQVDLLSACREMMKVVTEGMRALADIQRAQVQALTELHARRADEGGGGIDEEALLKLLAPMLPALLARNPAPAAAPNGAKTS